MGKLCVRCGETKPPEEYYRNTSRRDGLSGFCMMCSRGAVNDSYLRLKLRVIEHLGGRCGNCGYNADHRAFNIDHVNGDGASERRQGAGHGLGRKLLHAVLADDEGRYQLLCANCNWVKYVTTGGPSIRVYTRRAPVTSRVSKRCPRCGETKPSAEFCSNAARRDGLSTYCAPCKVADGSESGRRLRLQVIEHLGGRCKRCGYADNVHALVIDHVNGDGAAERKLGKGDRALFNAVLNDAHGRYQVLCANCNTIKRVTEVERGERVYVRNAPTERIDRPNQRWTAEARAAQAARSRELWQDPEHRARESARRSAAMKQRWASGEVPNRRTT